MANYTLQNLMDLEDVAAGRANGIQARFARDALDATQIGVSVMHFEPGIRAPYGHRHAVQEEVYLVLDGAGRLRVDDEVIDVRQWDAVRIAPTAIRTVEAGGGGMTLLAIGGPRPVEGDGEILMDDIWIDE